MGNLLLIVTICFVIIFLTMIIQLLLSIKIIREMKQQNILETKNGRNENELLHQQLTEEVVTSVLLKLFTIRNAVHKQTTNLHVKSIEYAPKNIGIQEDLLLQSFSKNKVDSINDYIAVFNRYIETYWLNKNGQLRSVFSGNIAQKSGEVGKMVVASEHLVPKLDLLLEKIQKEEEND